MRIDLIEMDQPQGLMFDQSSAGLPSVKLGQKLHREEVRVSKSGKVVSKLCEMDFADASKC